MTSQNRRDAGRPLVQKIALSVCLPSALGLLATVGVSLWIGHRRDFALDGGSVTLVTGALVTALMTATLLAQRAMSGETHARLREMEHRASHDELTGLLARDELRARLDVALRSAYRHDSVVGVLFLDLDGFKAINDSMGHEAGDELLQRFGERLRASVRSEDLVARFGGDEFVVVTLGLEREPAVREVAENVRRAFEAPVEIADGHILMTPSIGIAVGSRLNPARPDDLVANADQAMYRAKRHRLGIDVFDDHQRREVLGRREVEQSLVPALADGQFHVYYQPIISAAEARTVAVEGLVRWQHPVHGTLSPERFLEVAEAAGLIARLGEVVMREAVAQTSVWNHLYGPDHRTRVGVNVAERQLVDPAFADRVAEILAWAGVGADQLDLEIGEELLLRRIDDSSRVLHRVADLGCRIVIDDFGTTHGSLSRIRDLDLVRGVKVDRSIIAGLGKDDVSRAVVEATVSMSRALDIEVIAEGVETIEQRSMVIDLGIDLMQGFLFQEPLPADEFERVSGMVDALK
ncbi:MAG: EAL domain-containing protein [Acidimicrobiales bacterium]